MTETTVTTVHNGSSSVDAMPPVRSMCTTTTNATSAGAAVKQLSTGAMVAVAAATSPQSAAMACIAQAIKQHTLQSADVGVDVVDAGCAPPIHNLAIVAAASTAPAPPTVVSITHCNDPESCVTLADILKCFNAAVSEEQAWALIYQSVRLYRDALRAAADAAAAAAATAATATTATKTTTTTSGIGATFKARNGKHQPDTRLPNTLRNFNVHRDGTVHMSFNKRGE